MTTTMRCHAKNRAGRRCGRVPAPGETLCYQHAAKVEPTWGFPWTVALARQQARHFDPRRQPHPASAPIVLATHRVSLEAREFLAFHDPTWLAARDAGTLPEPSRPIVAPPAATPRPIAPRVVAPRTKPIEPKAPTPDTRYEDEFAPSVARELRRIADWAVTTRDFLDGIASDGLAGLGRSGHPATWQPTDDEPRLQERRIERQMRGLERVYAFDRDR